MSARLGIRRPRTKFLDVQKADLSYRKQRRHSKSQTRKMTRRLIDLLGKMLKEIREMERDYEKAESPLTEREKGDMEIITRMYRQQKSYFNRNDCRESIPDRIQTSFARRGRPFSEHKEKDFVRQELARVRATVMEGSFGMSSHSHHEL